MNKEKTHLDTISLQSTHSFGSTQIDIRLQFVQCLYVCEKLRVLPGRSGVVVEELFIGSEAVGADGSI